MFGKGNKMRGQAAMEYLMTYGWALLVIVIVIAILLIINPFSAPQGCRFDDLAFSCSNPAADGSGNLYMTITNGQNTAIKDVQVGCTIDKSPTYSNTPLYPVVYESGGTEIPRQGLIKIGTVNPVACDTGGRNYNIGDEFSGKVWLFYHTADEDAQYPLHSASASFVTKVGAFAG